MTERLPTRAMTWPAMGMVMMEPTTNASRTQLRDEDERWRSDLKTGMWAAQTPKPMPSTEKRSAVAQRAFCGASIQLELMGLRGLRGKCGQGFGAEAP